MFEYYKRAGVKIEALVLRTVKGGVGDQKVPLTLPRIRRKNRIPKNWKKQVVPGGLYPLLIERC